MENQSTYRIRTKLGETEPINIPVNLMQEYNSFEILSLKINTDDTYRSYTSTEGIVVGRVSTANNGLGIPNVRVSIFVPKGAYEQSDEESVIYPFSSPTDKDGDRVRYNLLPSESDVACYQIIGKLPSKRKILDNETICEVFDKYYKYTTVTNEAGDFMLTNIPVGKQRLHIDADLSDIGPFLSQKPYNMIENLGFEKNRFESTTQFKTSTDLDSLAQVISQDKSVHVYPYWGDITENGAEMKITRTDLSLNYEFKTQAIFIGSVITDKQLNSIRQNCTPTENAGKMSEMVTGPGRIEMIRKTLDNKIEQFKIKGDALINDNGVWCYAVPMNLDYVRTNEYGNIVPTDDPNKGVPTRARVRFRISLNEMESDNNATKRCSYLVPNNPKIDDEKFLKTNSADYSFGSDTWDESFVDLFYNKVYTVKNYVPQIQKTTRPTNRKHTGIKMVNHFGDNNPFPYNKMTIRLNFSYRLICVLVDMFIYLISFINTLVSIIGALPCWLAGLKLPLIGRPFKFVMKFVPNCIKLSSDFCYDGINKNVTYPGCINDNVLGCVWKKKTKPACDKEQYKISQNGGEAAVCTNKSNELFNCVENQLAQSNEATSFNFGNDWVNGCLYMPLWHRKIRPKKSFFFGLFKRRAKDEWCKGEQNDNGRSLRLASFCSPGNSKTINGDDYTGRSNKYYITAYKDNCGNKCHEVVHSVKLTNGVIMNRETMLGQKVWYYKAVEVTSSSDSSLANEYLNEEGVPMVSKILYATDIVLLGSLNDCDTNGIPKFFNYLSGSTYNMPTDVLFSDTEISYEFDEKGKLIKQKSHKTSVASGCDWGNNNEYGYNDGGLFYSIGCSNIKVNTASCINLRRICELGVGQDEIKYIDNIDVENKTGIGAISIESETDEMDYNNIDYNLRPDGFVSYDDINDFDSRSMFATLNGNNLKTKINKDSGVREYDFRYLYVDNFDGSLEELMANDLKTRKNANYRFNYNLEKSNKDYLLFRMGDRPFYYDGGSLVNSDENEGPKKYTLPKYQNSFYFYFGLKEGKTAIDLFNERYNEPCATKSEEEETILYESKPNSWCVSDTDKNNSFKHENYDGYLTVNLEDIPLPCYAILNSRTNSAVSYTITKDNGDTNITDDKICFYGSEGGINPTDKEVQGYTKYVLKYENPSYENMNEEGVNGCEMLTNGEYNLYIIDGEGNNHSFIISLNGEYLQFDDVEEKFGQPNNILLKYYKEEPYTPYNQVAISPNKNNISIASDEAGVPNVTRIDKEMTNLVRTEGLDKKGVKLNGTICIYNVKQEGKTLKDVLIEVEPFDRGKDDNGQDYYVDSDFWGSPGDENTKFETWYKKNIMNTEKIQNHKAIIVKENGREYVSDGGESEYFFFKTIDINSLKVDCYVIKCPKGDVNYRVRVTQLCQDKNGRYYKTQNYIERKINVAQPTSYKLFINDVDYDIIKNFKTGWTLLTDKGLQDPSDYHIGKKPFKNYNINEIHGWDKISDINNEYGNPHYLWGEEESKYGKTNETFETDDDTGYVLLTRLRDKEDEKPIEPQRFKYDNESKYNEDYGNWLKEYDEWENGKVGENGERLSGYNNWRSDNCGYKYLKESAEILLNRLEFVKQMKSSFWIQCENSEKTISYSVRTDDNPYDVWTMYNPENVSLADEDYNETESEPQSMDSTEREKWHYKGESVRYIESIKIPTLTSYDSKDFGIAEDSARQKMTHTYTMDKKMCFAQDNISGNLDKVGGISIKPPYLVACVNAEGISKPENLKLNTFFGKITNSYGLEMYKFGDEGGSEQKINDGKYEFFGYHLIDKIFAPDIVLWSYINNIPYYRPWYDYDEEPNDCYGPIWKKQEGNALGYTIKTEGIISGIIKNGITSSRGYVRDFGEKNIFDKDTAIKTFNNASEDDIPTNRCILYDEMKEDGTFVNTKINPDDFVYKNYRHIEPSKIKELHQFKPVPNREGELSFIDKDDNCNTTRTLYGSMKVTLLTNTLNDTSFAFIIIFGHKFPISDGENGDKSLTLKVKCSNVDVDETIMYYIFETSMRSKIGSAKNAEQTLPVWYPLNAFEVDTSKSDKYKYWLTFNEDDYKQHWDGSSKLAPQIFSKVTLEKDFRDKYDAEKYVAAKEPKSKIQWENEEGEVKYKETKGYGNTGIFSDLKHKPYFVVAVTKNNCCAISPVYDFHIVYYVAGLVDVGGDQKVLRTALVYVLKHRNAYFDCDNPKMDTDDGYNADSIGPYCKQPRNYYLTQFDFKINYTFSNGTTIVTNDNILYEKPKVSFLKREYFEDEDPIGSSYVKEGENGQFEIHTKNGGGVDQKTTSEKPSGNPLEPGKYSYKVTETVYNEKGESIQVVIWKIVDIDKDGNMSDDGSSEDNPGYPSPNGYVEITTTDPDTGKEIKTYKTFEYSTETIVTVDYDPRIPYFIRYNDKSLTADEYESLNKLFHFSIEEFEKNAKYYVTDVTGLKHRCKLHKIIKSPEEWEDVLKYTD